MMSEFRRKSVTRSGLITNT